MWNLELTISISHTFLKFKITFRFLSFYHILYIYTMTNLMYIQNLKYIHISFCSSAINFFFNTYWKRKQFCYIHLLGISFSLLSRIISQSLAQTFGNTCIKFGIGSEVSVQFPVICKTTSSAVLFCLSMLWLFHKQESVIVFYVNGNKCCNIVNL